MRNPCETCKHHTDMCKFFTNKGIHCRDKKAYLEEKADEYLIMNTLKTQEYQFRRNRQKKSTCQSTLEKLQHIRGF